MSILIDFFFKPQTNAHGNFVEECLIFHLSINLTNHSANTGQLFRLRTDELIQYQEYTGMVDN